MSLQTHYDVAIKGSESEALLGVTECFYLFFREFRIHRPIDPRPGVLEEVESFFGEVMVDADCKLLCAGETVNIV